MQKQTPGGEGFLGVSTGQAPVRAEAGRWEQRHGGPRSISCFAMLCLVCSGVATAESEESREGDQRARGQGQEAARPQEPT